MVPPHHLIRPIHIRPSHPIPSVPGMISQVKRRNRVPSRARRRTIDPSLWQPDHISGDQLASGASLVGTMPGEWVYEESQRSDDIEEDGRVVIGAWRRVVNGELVEETVVRSAHQPHHRSDMLYDVEAGEFSASRSGSPLFDINKQDTSTSFLSMPRKETSGSFDQVHEQNSPSPLFAPRPKALWEAEKNSNTSISSMPGGSGGLSQRSLSPLFPERPLDIELTSAGQPTSESSLSKNENRNPIASIPEPLRKQFESERISALAVLNGLTGDSSESVHQTPQQERRNEWGGFSESEDEEDILRLRGGAASMESDDDSEGEEATGSSGSDSDEVETDEELKSDDSNADLPSDDLPAQTQTQSDIHKPKGLKSLFDPTNTNGM